MLALKNNAERATQTTGLQSTLAKLLWHYRLLLVSVVIIPTKTAVRFYFNYFPFSNAKLTRNSKSSYNPILVLTQGHQKRRKQFQLKLSFLVSPSVQALKWPRLSLKSSLLRATAGLNVKLWAFSSGFDLFQQRLNVARPINNYSPLVLFQTDHKRHRQLVKLIKGPDFGGVSPTGADESCTDPKSVVVRESVVLSKMPLAKFGGHQERTSLKYGHLRKQREIKSSIPGLAGNHFASKAAQNNARACSTVASSHFSIQNVFLESKTIAKTTKNKRRSNRSKSPQKSMTIKDRLAYQRTLDYMKLVAIESKAALADLERAEAEQAAAEEFKRKVESGEIDLQKPKPNRFDLAFELFFSPKKKQRRSSERTASSSKKSTGTTGEKQVPACNDVAKKESDALQTPRPCSKVRLLQPWRKTIKCSKVTTIRDKYLFLKVSHVLGETVNRQVTLAGRNILALAAGDNFDEYKTQILVSLPHLYLTRLFFINDLVTAVIATTLLRSSQILAFYLARLLERLPRHTWFFHVFNRVMSVFKFYCRAPISLKVLVKGRVNKKLRKQTICVLRTQVALSTLDCAVDYSLAHSFTSASVLGIKVWVVSNSRAAKTKTFSQRYKTY